ncbi:hypothetical protein KXS11_17915 [Plantibacter flavus]|uniref:hypothetical protein n=1 Tax=Plantibacter flavus TaxID=150123 RepID=UPI003F18C096
MTIITALFAVGCVVLVTKLPRLLRGEGTNAFVATLLLTLAIGLAIPQPYLVIDRLLGGHNVANLILHLMLTAAFFFIGLGLADAHLGERARRLIKGPVGLVVLALVLGLTILFFALSDTSDSASGMSAVDRQWTITAYGTMGRVYPAFIALAIIPPMAAAVANQKRSRSLRVVSALQVAAFSITVLTLPIQALELIPGIDVGGVYTVPTWIAVGFFLAGSVGLELARYQGQDRQVAEEDGNAAAVPS